MSTTSSGNNANRPGGFTNGGALPILRYRRADDPRWMQRLNNFSAITLFLYVLAHIGVLALARVSPDAFNKAIAIYQHPVGVIGIWALVAMLVFHFLSGLRIAAIDLSAWGAAHSRQLRGMIGPLWFIVMIPASYYLLRHTAAVLLGEA